MSHINGTMLLSVVLSKINKFGFGFQIVLDFGSILSNPNWNWWLIFNLFLVLVFFLNLSFDYGFTPK
jgi:hypothetical protein